MIKKVTFKGKIPESGWKVNLDRSKRYVRILAPTIVTDKGFFGFSLNKISIYFPNRDELSFLVVFALPKAYRNQKV